MALSSAIRELDLRKVATNVYGERSLWRARVFWWQKLRLIVGPRNVRRPNGDRRGLQREKNSRKVWKKTVIEIVVEYSKKKSDDWENRVLPRNSTIEQKLFVWRMCVFLRYTSKVSAFTRWTTFFFIFLLTWPKGRLQSESSGNVTKETRW